MTANDLASGSLARIVLAAAARRGVDRDQLLAAAGLNREILAESSGGMPLALEVRLWGEAIRLSGDPDLPLHAAEQLRPGTFGALDFAARMSATLGDCYRTLVRYHRLVHDGVRLALELRGDLVVLTHHTRGEAVEPSRGRSDFALAALVVAGRQATGRDWAPREVAFQHGRPSRLDEYERVFRAPLRFGAPRDQVTLDARLLALPTARADADLRRVLDRQATEQLARLPSGTTLSARVRCLLADGLGDGTPTAAIVARRFHLSPRQLQRCLSREGTSFHALATTLRRSQAEHLLGATPLPLAAIAARLGFSEPSAFHRAFKRWTGTTPARFRDRRRLASSIRRTPDPGRGRGRPRT